MIGIKEQLDWLYDRVGSNRNFWLGIYMENFKWWDANGEEVSVDRFYNTDRIHQPIAQRVCMFASHERMNSGNRTYLASDTCLHHWYAICDLSA